MKQTFSKEDALMEIIDALRDDNNEVIIQAVDAKFIGNNSWYSNVYKDETFIPAKYHKYGNRIHAKSIKVGKDITINKKTNGGYLVRTPKGEVTFTDWKDSDLDVVMLALLNKYENGPKGNYMYPITHHARNQKLVLNAMGQKTPKASKFKQATEQMEKLGVVSEEMKKKMLEKFSNYSIDK